MGHRFLGADPGNAVEGITVTTVASVQAADRERSRVRVDEPPARGQGAARPGGPWKYGPAVPRSRPLVALVLVAALVVAACSGDDGGSSEGSGGTDAVTTTAVALPEGPAPDEPGEYGVGRSTVTLVDESRDGRSLTVDAWYPIDPEAAADAEPSTYAFIPGVQFETERARDGVPVATDGPFPLVVFSHGSGGIRFQSTFLTEILASQGYVVLAPDHTGNTAYDRFLGTDAPPEENAVNRPTDVSFVIDQLVDEVSSPLADLGEQVDPERIGVVGHSAGGYTALAVAGGVRGAPADERVDAVVGLAAAAEGMSEETLVAVDVPTLLVSGTSDVTTTIEEHTEPAWEGVTGGPVVRVDITDAGHQSFADVCVYRDLIPTLDDPPAALVEAIEDFAVEGCAPELLDIDRAQEITDIFTIGFLDEFVAGDPEAGAYLIEAYAETIPEIAFQRR